MMMPLYIKSEAQLECKLLHGTILTNNIAVHEEATNLLAADVDNPFVIWSHGEQVLNRYLNEESRSQTYCIPQRISGEARPRYISTYRRTENQRANHQRQEYPE